MNSFIAALGRLQSRQFEPIQVCPNCEQSLKAASAAHDKVLRSQANVSSGKAQLLKIIAAAEHQDRPEMGQLTRSGSRDSHLKAMLQQHRLDHTESQSAREYAIAMETAMQQLGCAGLTAEWLTKARVAHGSDQPIPDIGIDKELTEAALFVESILGRKWHGPVGPVDEIQLKTHSWSRAATEAHNQHQERGRHYRSRLRTVDSWLP